MAAIFSRPQCVKSPRPNDDFLRLRTRPPSIQIMAYRLFDTGAGLLRIRLLGTHVCGICMNINIQQWI